MWRRNTGRDECLMVMFAEGLDARGTQTCKEKLWNEAAFRKILNVSKTVNDFLRCISS